MHIQVGLQSCRFSNKFHVNFLRDPAHNHLLTLLWDVVPLMEVGLLGRSLPAISAREETCHSYGGRCGWGLCCLLAPHSNSAPTQKSQLVSHHHPHGSHSDHGSCSRLHELLCESHSLRLPVGQLPESIQKGDSVSLPFHTDRTTASGWITAHKAPAEQCPMHRRTLRDAPKRRDKGDSPSGSSLREWSRDY